MPVRPIGQQLMGTLVGIRVAVWKQACLNEEETARVDAYRQSASGSGSPAPRSKASLGPAHHVRTTTGTGTRAGGIASRIMVAAAGSCWIAVCGLTGVSPSSKSSAAKATRC